MSTDFRAGQSQRPFQRCAGPVDRRTFLKIGGLSLGALTTGLNPSLSQILAAQADNPATDSEFSVILLWAGGGPSHIDTFDMKPEAPENYRGPFKPIATNVPGMDICELLPNLARLGDKISIV